MNYKEIFLSKEFGMLVAGTIDCILKFAVIWFFCRAAFKYVYGY